MMTYESIVAKRGDREWQDGDDSELYDEGYADGYAQALADLRAEGVTID